MGDFQDESQNTAWDLLREHVSLSFPRALTCISGADKVDFNVPYMPRELVAGSGTKLTSLSDRTKEHLFLLLCLLSLSLSTCSTGGKVLLNALL